MDEYFVIIRKASADIWKFFKMYAGIKTKDDEKWEECLKVADELVKLYEGTEAEKYARKYVVLIISELERIGKKNDGK